VVPAIEEFMLTPIAKLGKRGDERIRTAGTIRWLMRHMFATGAQLARGNDSG
jgi:hypothetical protein